jgi:hypothetical protein
MVEAIVLGMFERGLLEPHDPRLTDRFVESVRQYVAETNAVPFAHVKGTVGHLEQLVNNGVEEVEVFGIWQHRCVSYVAKMALNAGLKVRIPKEYIRPESFNNINFKNFVGAVSKIDINFNEDREFYYFAPSNEVKTRLIDFAGGDAIGEILIRRYGGFVDVKEIKPKLITLSKEGMFPLTEKQRAVFCTEGRDIKGIATYELIPEGNEDIGDVLNARLSIYDLSVHDEKVSNVDFSQQPGFRDYIGSGELIELELIESFVPGTGRLLVDSIKNSRPVELIMAWSSPEIQDFYEKLGFVDSGVHYYETDSPLMVWHNG